MSGLCGSFCRDRAGPTNAAVIATMAAAINRFDASALRRACAEFGAVAVAGVDVDVFQAAERLVAVWGCAHFSDAEFSGLAQSHGIAHALAQGHARERTDERGQDGGTRNGGRLSQRRDRQFDDRRPPCEVHARRQRSAQGDALVRTGRCGCALSDA